MSIEIALINIRNGVNIKENEDYVLNNSTGYFCYLVAKLLQDKSNIREHEKVIINNGDLDVIYLFARDVKNSNKQLLSEITLESNILGHIKKYYHVIDFDKSRYDLYFKNLIFL